MGAINPFLRPDIERESPNSYTNGARSVPKQIQGFFVYCNVFFLVEMIFQLDACCMAWETKLDSQYCSVTGRGKDAARNSNSPI